MKAIVFDQYGPPEKLKFHDVAEPQPKAGQVLLKVHAAALNAADWHLLRADPMLVRLMCGLFSPRDQRLGADVAGVVEALGPGVTRLKVGDEVFGCLPIGSLGSYAEKACAPETVLVHKPAAVSFAQAAAVPLAALTALQALRKECSLQPGEKALINGASGGVGSFAVQIAKAMGAEVTAVCSSRNVELARSIGADHVIDYSKEDFTRGDKRYDVILAANGYHTLAEYKRVLTPQGRYVMTGGAGKQMAEAIFYGPFYSERHGRKFKQGGMKANVADLEYLRGLMETGKLVPVIDRSYNLEQVPEAIAYLEEGHARGKVVITV